DLATIETEADVSRIAIPAGGFGWIGLHDDPSAWKKVMTADPNSWRWSFFLVNDTKRTWAGCQSVCRQQYLDLAMIESKTEDEAVLEVMANVSSAWIGLNREPWVWSDFSNSTFRNCVIYQPRLRLNVKKKNKNLHIH
uniref:C-type lectin domain-containing protein n=1 Tax=Periophthalmus magnuspinnatus TaxID=409849 RepID=A0A3B3Z6Z1_9GOBI